MECQFTMRGDVSSIFLHLTSNLISIDSQSDTSWHTIWCKFTSYWIQIDSQSDSNWDQILGHYSMNQLSIECHLRSKTLDWHRFRIWRVPPLKFSQGPLDQWEASIRSSRPMRSLDFGHILGVGQIWSLPIQRKCANWLTHECHWNANGIPMDYHWNVNWLAILC